MYRINKSSNTIQQLEKKSFSTLGFREREHLQEWIAKNPSSLGEDLLIIQKEFSGFEDTQERLDLLALDKKGALVIIENKLDDSGRDVTWQALKYASYCSNLSKLNITQIFQSYLDVNGGGRAEEQIVDFMNGLEFEDIVLNKTLTQRVILVAAKFRKEVTSTVLWLMNFKVRLQCFKVTPYELDQELLLNVEQVIPTIDAEDYMIGMAEKASEDLDDQAAQNTLHMLRSEFWSHLLTKMNATSSTLYQNISTSKYHWIGASTGVRGVGLNFVVTNKFARAEVYIDRGSADENKSIFDYFYAQKNELERAFDGELIWERLDDKRGSRIKTESAGNIKDREQWGRMAEFMVNSMCELEKAIRPLLADIPLP